MPVKRDGHFFKLIAIMKYVYFLLCLLFTLGAQSQELSTEDVQKVITLQKEYPGLTIWVSGPDFQLPETQNIKVIPVKNYQITKQKVWGWSFIAVGGFMDGMNAGFQFQNRKSFERKWDVDPYGFWGSQSWRKAHDSPNLWNQSMGTFDFYHLSEDLSFLGYIGGGVTVALGAKKCRQKWQHHIYDFLVSVAVGALSKQAGLHLIRQ